MKTRIASSIVLHNLQVNIFLGWPDAERAQTQTVEVDLKIQFVQPPAACLSDDLRDTICYDGLTQAIEQHITAQPVRLLEYLGHEIYQVTKKFLSVDALVLVRVKKNPPIKNLTGGAAFDYGDAGCAW